jgi:hypothetical protein
LALDDQKSPAQIWSGPATAETEQDLQEYVLSQIKRVIWGDFAGNWNDDFEAASILSLADLDFRTNIPLLGAKDGTNRTFTTPHVFRNVGDRTIQIYHNGRRLLVATGGSPATGDFIAEEGGGPGTGFNTVRLLTFSPVSRSTLTADYLAI